MTRLARLGLLPPRQACKTSRCARMHLGLGRNLRPLPPPRLGHNQPGSSRWPQVQKAEPARHGTLVWGWQGQRVQSSLGGRGMQRPGLSGGSKGCLGALRWMLWACLGATHYRQHIQRCHAGDLLPFGPFCNPEGSGRGVSPLLTPEGGTAACQAAVLSSCPGFTSL